MFFINLLSLIKDYIFKFVNYVNIYNTRVTTIIEAANLATLKAIG